MTLTESNEVRFEKNWERKANPESEFIYVLSCSRDDPYVVTERGEKIEIEYDGEDRQHAKEDVTNIWRWVCRNKHEILE